MCVFITAVPIIKLFAGREIVEDMCYERRRAEACLMMIDLLLFLQKQKIVGIGTGVINTHLTHHPVRVGDDEEKRPRPSS